MKHCHICYNITEDEDDEYILICDRCGEYYCGECSYAHTYYFSYEGNMCHLCSGQHRRQHLSKEELRDRKINFTLNGKDRNM